MYDLANKHLRTPNNHICSYFRFRSLITRLTEKKDNKKCHASVPIYFFTVTAREYETGILGNYTYPRRVDLDFTSSGFMFVIYNLKFQSSDLLVEKRAFLRREPLWKLRKV